MSTREEFRGNLKSAGEEMIHAGHDKLAFINGDIAHIEERIKMAAGLAKHLSGLMEQILEELGPHYQASSDFHDRSQNIMERTKALLDSTDEGPAKRILDAMFNVHCVEVAPVQSDLVPLFGYIDKIDKIGRGLERTEQRFDEVNSRRTDAIQNGIEGVQRNLEDYLNTL